MMRYITPLLLLFALVLSACQPIVAPEGMVVAEEVDAGEGIAAAPAVEVNFYTSHAGHERFGMIDLASAVGTDIGQYINPEVTILRTEWFADNGALYEDAFYTMLNKRLPEGSTPDDAEAQLARVDMATGAVELVGSVIPLNLVAMEINPCGEVFSTGFTFSNQLGELYGDTNLYRVDRITGALDLIGDTGIEQIMDMSFAPDGALWATVGNVLYTLDLKTGAPTEMVTITGVEDDLEIMGIGFTSEGILYGTTPFADGFYTIDTTSGEVTEVGRHGLAFPHGGDIPMSPQVVNCEGSTLSQQAEPEPSADADTRIVNALSAAPASIAGEAAVLDWPTAENPGFTELRAGSNGWSCFPDDPATPSNDPQCFDAQWLEWLTAFFEGRDPEITTWGWAYMLQGGSAASDVDPSLTEPPAGEDWLIGGPHLMLIGPEPFDTSLYATSRGAEQPYIMWAGTPYEHFMIPVQMDIPAATDDPVANALSAAPDSIAAEAAVLDWPSSETPNFPELRAGTNGWSCFPDDPATPTNDPQCFDAQWLEWLTAFFEGREPEITAIGFSYMLQGGSAASDADPSLAAPDGDWLVGPPHVMMIAPDAFTSAHSVHRDSGEPYIMYAGTPYEHFMAPSQLDGE